MDPAHAKDEAGQARLVQVEAGTDVPAPEPDAPKPDEVTEDDGSGMAGGVGQQLRRFEHADAPGRPALSGRLRGAQAGRSAT